MRFLSLGKIDKRIIPIIVGCVFSFLSRLLYTYEDAKVFHYSIISNTFSSLSKLFTLIPFIILKTSLNNNNTNNNTINNTNSNNNIELIYTDNSNEIIQGMGRYLILSAVIYFAQAMILFNTIEIKTNFWILNLLIASLLYYFIFKIKLYKHHYLSLILITLIGLILDLVFGNLQNDLSNNLFKLFLRLLREILHSSVDVINKYIMDKKYCSIYAISLSNGVINLILLGIFELFNYYYFKLEDLGEYFSNFNITESLVLLGFMITQLGIYLCALITNKQNSPCHIFIIYVFGQLGYYMDFSSHSIIVIICLIFILFFSLIFNEIIEINFWGLSDNTKRKIIYRAESDNLTMEKTFTVDDNEDNLLKGKRTETMELQPENEIYE